ncbi:MAG: thiamine-phosphate kinase [Gammaproteobacteria bacterium]|nr:thiamine-phosphate kinase [Gammaproteobacteria bacterium]
MNEKHLIQKYFSRKLDDESIIEGIGDDAAIVSTNSDCELVITTDTMSEGNHFSKQAPAFAVGYKLMASNLSDAAAMGATPRWATLNITLDKLNESWLEQFSNGLHECAEAHNVMLIGGDTTKGSCLNASIQLIAEVPIGKAMLRSGAHGGDKIYVTGVIGNAFNALEFLQENDFNHRKLSDTQFSALYMPESRIDLALELREIANAAIDISDGLLHELELMCSASHTGAILYVDDIPINDDIDFSKAIIGGEDYELLFSAPAEFAEEINNLSKKHNCLISCIGEMTNNTIIELYHGSKVIPYPKYTGYDHFAP